MPKHKDNADRRVELSFYREESSMSSPGKHEDLFFDLPRDIRELCHIAQNTILHQFWIGDGTNYGVSVASLKAAGRDLNAEINLRTVEEILDLLLQMDDRPLAVTRSPNQRVVGNCRDFSLLLASMLRYRDIPARIRSGVARYFFPTEGHLEDHFICEFWNFADQRWQQVDAQIDNVQQEVLKPTMDMTDLPRGQFLNAGEAYVELKEGRVAPGKIGIFEYLGLPYVHYKLVSDLACVNNVEVLAWEGWGVCEDIDANTLTEDDLALLGEIADILIAMNTNPAQFARARALFETHPKLQMPSDYRPYYYKLPSFD